MKETKALALASILGAISALLEIIPGPPFDVYFPLYTKISWDLTGLPIILTLLLCGPVYAAYSALIGCSIIFLRGNVFGGTLKLIAELATVIGFSIFRWNRLHRADKPDTGALGSQLALAAATFTAVVLRVSVMTAANLLLLPLFYPMWMSTPAVVALLIPIGVFNVTQALINIVPAYAIYMKLPEPLLVAET